MDWFDQIDGYCERTDLSYWSEPLNAVTNAAFILAAIVMWRRTAGVVWGRALCAILFAIGIGSYLFHTHATVWAMLADTTPIVMFILVYLFLVNWHLLRWRVWAATLGTLGFLPYAAGVTLILTDVPFLSVSNFYWSVPILLAIYALALWRRRPQVGRGFAVGAGLLVLSICLRSLDQPLCAGWPIGTHIFWHILNGIMLGWMIEVYRRHMVEAQAVKA